MGAKVLNFLFQMDGDVRSSSDEISDSSVDSANKPAVQQNGTPKKQSNSKELDSAQQSKPVPPTTG